MREWAGPLAGRPRTGACRPGSSDSTKPPSTPYHAAVVLSFAVVGPGRVGTALACLWVDSGCRCLGFAGGSPASARRAIERCGQGAVLDRAAAVRAHVVLLTPPDSELRAVVRDCAAAAPPGPRLWLHTSGLFDLDVLAPLRGERVRLGSLHPLCPVPDPTAGVRDLPGKPAVVAGGGKGRLLELLARRAGLLPVRLEGGIDRAVYHAACALAANGLTALADLVQELLERSGGGDAGRSLAVALMRAALDSVARAGAAAALSGPVQRGDRHVIERHLRALSSEVPDALPVYRALMERAAQLAGRAGHLAPAQVEAVAALLRQGGADGG